MLAQALVEYGMLSSLVATFQNAAITAEDYLQAVDARVALGVIVVAAFLFFMRR